MGTSGLLVVSIVLPVAGVLVVFAAAGRQEERIALATMPLGLAMALAIAVVAGARPRRPSNGPSLQAAGPCAACAGSGGAGAVCDLAVARVLPWHTYRPMSAPVNPLTVAALISALWPLHVGGLTAVLMGPWRVPFSELSRVLLSLADRTRCVTVASATGADVVDGAPRQWPAASLAVSVLVLIFGLAMLAGH
jgi:hypothetical protein